MLGCFKECIFIYLFICQLLDKSEGNLFSHILGNCIVFNLPIFYLITLIFIGNAAFAGWEPQFCIKACRLFVKEFHFLRFFL